MNRHTTGYVPTSHYSRFQDHPQLHLSRAQVPIDMQAIVSGVQRYPIPQSYIPLPPGVDPAAVDFRTFFPYNPSEVKHRKRTTRSQLKVLEDTFKLETKPNATLRKNLAAQLEMTPRGVQVWFQNRRAKEKALAKKVSSDRPLQFEQDDENDDDDDDAGPTEVERVSISVESSDKGLTTDAQTSDLYTNKTKLTSPPASGVQGMPTMEDRSPSTQEAPDQFDMANSMRAVVSANDVTVMGNDNSYIYNSRRGSLPTHIGSRTGFEGGPHPPHRLRNHGSVGPGGLIGFDPLARRLSLDRLASHPYARVAIAANNAIYGPSYNRSYCSPRMSIPSRMQDQRSLYDNSRRPDMHHRGSVPNSRLQSSTFYEEPSPALTAARNYQAPIPGPLPEPNFSFGAPNIPSTEGDNIQNGYSYREHAEFDEGEDQSSPYGVYSRFGSMASVAGSESSTGGPMFFEGGMRDLSDRRRSSFNGQVVDMLSNLGVDNESQSSLQDPSNHNVNIDSNRSTPNNSSSPSSSTVSGGTNTGRGVSISSSSELANALDNEEQKVSDVHNGYFMLPQNLEDTLSHPSSGMIDTDSGSTHNGHRSSMSSSGSSIIYPLSASSSQSSLSLVPPNITHQMSDTYTYDEAVDAVSGTGHYSPMVESFDIQHNIALHTENEYTLNRTKAFSEANDPYSHTYLQ